MLLIDYARDVVGMPTRGLYFGRHIGWTTDEAKKDLMLAAGATVMVADTMSGRLLGWEISFPIGLSTLAQEEAA